MCVSHILLQAMMMRDNPVVPTALSKAILILGVVFIALQASSAEAAVVNPPGFWAGLGDGFLSLIKLLVSLVANVTLFDREARSLSYDIGFFLGVFGFAGLAGAVDSASEAAPVVRIESILKPRGAISPPSQEDRAEKRPQALPLDS